MNILVTGNLYSITRELSVQLCVENKLVLAAEKFNNKHLHNKAVSYSYSPKDKLFPKLFNTYSFDAVVFLSARGENQNKQEAGGIDELNIVLGLCAERKVSKFIFVSSSEVYAGISDINESSKPAPIDSFGCMLASAEALCEFYRQKHNINAVILHVPYLYGEHIEDSFITRIIMEAKQTGKVKLPDSDKHCDFVKNHDLARLIRLIIEDQNDADAYIINVGTGKPVTFGELAALITAKFKDASIEHVTDVTVPPPVLSKTARKLYDWVPYYDITSDFSWVAQNISMERPKRKPFISRLREKMRRQKTLLQIFELLLGACAMEYLNHITATSVQFRFIDFRLLYVVILGGVHGMRTGIMAAVISGLSFAFSYFSTGIGWQVLVYNVENWLPLVAFVIAGAVTGYIKDKSANALRFKNEQLASLEESYLFLYELYDNTLDNKNQYKDQLLSYRDSFGRIYSITKKLDNVISDAVFQEAIHIFEDVLENKSVIIYTVTPDRRYGRLVVCSREMSDKAERSIELSRYGAMVNSLDKDEVWYNGDMLPDYPVFCAPVYDRDNLVAITIVQKAGYSKMGTYYLNLIKVLNGLMQASLIRAANYMAEIEAKIYINGTRILKNEKFSEILSIRRAMKENKNADFKLLKVKDGPKDKIILSGLIDKGIRKSDIAGEGRNGDIFLIMSQAKQESVELLLKRLKGLGVLCSLVETAESADI
ncbi:MAG: NAD-dependent epimerase/dehydratase family protein [Christensenellales bacterium]